MNIIEAYAKFNKELIIIISGLSGSGKTKMSSQIEKFFKIKKIDIELLCNDQNNKTVALPNGIVVKDWDHIDSYNWDKINNEVNANKQNGVIVCGPYFPQNKLKFSPSFHIHIKVSKQQILENRRQYIIANKDKCEELVQFVHTPTEMLMINQITYPHYMEYLKESKIDKFIDMREMNNDQVYEQIETYLLNSIQKYLDEFNKNLPFSNKKLASSDSSNMSEIINVSKPEKKSDSSTNSSDSDKITKDTEFLLGTTEDEIGELNYVK